MSGRASAPSTRRGAPQELEADNVDGAVGVRDHIGVFVLRLAHRANPRGLRPRRNPATPSPRHVGDCRRRRRGRLENSRCRARMMACLPPVKARTHPHALATMTPTMPARAATRSCPLTSRAVPGGRGGPQGEAGSPFRVTGARRSQGRLPHQGSSDFDQGGEEHPSISCGDSHAAGYGGEYFRRGRRGPPWLRGAGPRSVLPVRPLVPVPASYSVASSAAVTASEISTSRRTSSTPQTSATEATSPVSECSGS